MRFFNVAACVLLSCAMQFVAAAPTGLLPEQTAMLEERAAEKEAEDGPTSVSIIFDSSDLSARSFDHVVKIPLNKRIPTRRSDDLVTLPTHPQRARILRSLTTRTIKINGIFEAEEEVEPDIECVAHPKIEEHPYSWTSQDGQVNFDDEEGQWYLDGREVESYECKLV